MNGLEQKYSVYLEERKAAGEIADWMFDSVKLRLGPKCYITVDFAVILPDGVIEFHETKGFMEGDALIKLKWVAEKFWWFRFIVVKAKAKRDGGGFSFREFE
jgi:hypothetical protein